MTADITHVGMRCGSVKQDDDLYPNLLRTQLLPALGISPMVKEQLDAHKAQLIHEAGIKEPKSFIWRSLIKFVMMLPETLVQFVALAFIIGGIVSSILCVGLAFGANSNDWIPIVSTLTVCIVGLFVLSTMESYSIVTWERMQFDEWKRNHLVPLDIIQLVQKINYYIEDLGVTGVRCMVEYPSCRKIADPILVLEWIGEKTKDEAAVIAWM